MELSVSHARALRILTKNLQMRPGRCGNWNVYCEGGKLENPEINPRSRAKSNNKHLCGPLVTPDPPGPRPPWWEANKCSIPSLNRQYLFFCFWLAFCMEVERLKMIDNSKVNAVGVSWKMGWKFCVYLSHSSPFLFYSMFFTIAVRLFQVQCLRVFFYKKRQTLDHIKFAL